MEKEIKEKYAPLISLLFEIVFWGVFITWVCSFSCFLFFFYGFLKWGFCSFFPFFIFVEKDLFFVLLEAGLRYGIGFPIYSTSVHFPGFEIFVFGFFP
eukprot:TRINITY_DN7290_c2_g1_i1.p1 TRINITY_DN7290_c2_g1~~TRINITY_DN7290_c2_g1_i1.p1  ORF type:complete len:114 (+),score=13.41 TRINITY_DN7290_c2_g1_i1:51-344(+)